MQSEKILNILLTFQQWKLHLWIAPFNIWSQIVKNGFPVKQLSPVFQNILFWNIGSRQSLNRAAKVAD